jgi:ribonuclease HII
LLDFNFDKSFENPIVGIDEVGRGSWAGPVIAAACLIKQNKSLPKNLNDSKKLSPKIRFEIFEALKKIVYFGIGVSSNNEIDNYGIQKATFNAMERAFIHIRKKINKKKISTLLIDGNQNPHFKDKFGAEMKLIIKGDTISPSIAAASILAKCTRDLYMLKMDSILEGYGFASNMGYGTKIHKSRLLSSGPTQLHRMTFAPMKDMK